MDTWYELNIKPRDVFFFRDAKPMEAASVGHGANWPVPQVFHNALLTALHDMDHLEFEHRHQVNDKDKNRNSSFRFGGLKTVGLFPSIDKTMYLPTPVDLQYGDDNKSLTLLQPREKGLCDLPPPLTRVLSKDGKAGKKKPDNWLSVTDFECYLKNDLANVKPQLSSFLYDVESRPGIGVDAESKAAEDGKFYMAQYMRLNKDVTLTGFAQCRQKRYKDGTDEDILEYFFKERKSTPLVLGGQQGLAYLENIRQPNGQEINSIFSLPFGSSKHVKWILLTPAIFTDGWLPSWIDLKTGKLLTGDIKKPEREPGESRKTWRMRFEQGGIDATLVAACVPKPQVYSGWRAHGGRMVRDEKTGEEKPAYGPFQTRLCVPAGSVYYFETNQPEKLIAYLNGKTRSDELAEKGFGFGVCGTWEPAQ